MVESKEFAGELFEAMARRRRINAENGITEEELKRFWEQITDQDLDSRLQIFFDMQASLPSSISSFLTPKN